MSVVSIRVPDQVNPSLDVSVQSEHPKARKWMAEIVAKTFAENRLEDVSEDDPTTIEFTLKDRTKVPFRMQRVKKLDG